MSSWMICNKCGHIFQTRRSRTKSPWRQRKQCNKCWSNKLTEFSHKFIIEKYKEMIIESLKRTRSDKYKEVREKLKDQPKRAAVKTEPQIQKMVPVFDQEKEPEPQYPEGYPCFGNLNIHSQVCLNCAQLKDCSKISKK